MFTTPKPNVIESDSGFSVEVVGNGRTASLRYAEGAQVFHAAVEWLAGSPAALALIRDSLFPTGSGLSEQLTEGAKDRVIENIRAAFLSQDQVIAVVSRS